MKIRSKIALRYTGITVILMLIFSVVTYMVSAKDRENEFFNDLKKEGVSKANLYFEAKTPPEVMHSIYKNNIEYLDEVEVAIYNKEKNLLYHDAKDIDIVKETEDLLNKVENNNKNITFYEGKYQVVCFLYSYQNTDFIVTAAAYDGYGYSKLHRLATNLSIALGVSVILLFIIGYFLAKRALSPVADISEQITDITAKNLHLRLPVFNNKDEFGELSLSFNNTLDRLEASFDAQKMFVGNVSHELRTPLATLIGEIDYALLNDRTPDEYKAILNNMRQDATRLIKLMNGLLDLAKASYDKSKISTTPLRLDELILDAREVVLKGEPEYNVNLIFTQEIEDESDLTIYGNEYLLKLAFANLMENNCKFSENKTSNVRISTYNKSIIIQFTDEGIGISPKDMKNIFIPFFRGRNKSYVQGNGIGMALVERVVNLHKGQIEIQSEVGEGTIFIVRFSVDTVKD